jgi:hypothetical protein
MYHMNKAQNADMAVLLWFEVTGGTGHLYTLQEIKGAQTLIQMASVRECKINNKVTSCSLYQYIITIFVIVVL